ncbi:MAG TPA: ComEA family DNA-binding protein, partial [Usitatibacteraceae bacterium]|nr:ComEA family DNA-binding protein [Usitatibacteraceae bacterium]
MKRIIGLFVALFAWAGIALAAVNINSATKEQLETLDGIGPVKAQAIIDYRKKNGPFRTLEDLKKVDGIGDATFDKVRKDIMLTGTTKVDSPAKAEPKKAEPKKEEPKKAAAKKEEPKKEKAAAA